MLELSLVCLRPINMVKKRPPHPVGTLSETTIIEVPSSRRFSLEITNSR
ncbi:hypothetical protein SBF1_660030 [Candidatus Desulfosporosinus infrequens]|uniref:Uncharacterized protein n=1 Tax=Candidatus Desulfosporosinus infrequens TaxID=2043169 RepID=A0A2U3LNJ3_9FIRM|nr:hypothetical protein SBF1_660030 [Candidatus Desulfosporosinus infrequens]